MTDVADSTYSTWLIRADRRQVDLPALRAEIESLASGIQDLDLHWVSDADFEAAPDGGAFRDFVPIASIGHSSAHALEFIAEELLDHFGWVVDFKPQKQSSSDLLRSTSTDSGSDLS